MIWKFEYNQADDAPKGTSMMKYIDAPLEWIESIIDVELDFHIGKQVCMKEENKGYLTQYLDNPWAGYGKYQFSEGPNLSESKFYPFFLNR
jgi:hypothetical protein